MKITLAEFYVMLDALEGSTHFAERGDGYSTWKFDRDTRRRVLDRITEQMGKVVVELAVEGGETKQP